MYFGLARIWGLPYGEEIVGTITVIDTFLGGLLGISTANYYKEQEQLKQDEMEYEDIESEEEILDEAEKEKQYFEEKQEMEDEL